MPRLPPALIRKAWHTSPHVATLLPICRDIPSGVAELRWIRQHAEARLYKLRNGGPSRAHKRHVEAAVARLCWWRGHVGVPLQYLLGTQPFGALELFCAPGVLIPRPETEAYTMYLAQILDKTKRRSREGEMNQVPKLRILDICSGTGCIALGLYSQLRHRFHLDVRGLDISPGAISLARRNVRHNFATHSDTNAPSGSVEFHHADIFDPSSIRGTLAETWDVIASNPPYVAPDSWACGRGEIGVSVRRHEPELALVPSAQIPCPTGWIRQDAFYARLLALANIIKPKYLLLELGDESQAKRVLACAERSHFLDGWTVEVWRDWPDLKSLNEDETTELVAEDNSVADHCPAVFNVKGSGNIRSLFLQRKSSTNNDSDKHQ